MRELNQKMARGAVWMALLKFTVRSVGLVSTMILARLLVPADFGLIAMATSIMVFLNLATAFSFDIPLIQNQSAEDRHFDTAWTLNALFRVGLTVLLLVLAYPAAAFFHEDRLFAVINVLAFSFLITGFENIGVVHFRKQLNFRKDFVLSLAKKLVSVSVTIPLAFFLRSYWALVAGIVVGNVIGVAITYSIHPYRPKFSLSASRDMLNFSKWLILNNAINLFRNRSADFIIGRMSGMSSLGVFTVAFEIATLPTTEVVAPINRVVFPGYSKLASSQEKLRESFIDVLAVIALITLPAGIGIGAIAEPLVHVFLGSKWTAAVPLVELLAIYGAINALQTNTGSVFNAVGKPYLITTIGAANIAVLLTASISLALNYGTIGVAVAYVFTTVMIMPLTYYFVCKELDLRVITLLDVLWRPMLGSAIMFFSINYVAGWLSIRQDINSVVMLFALIATGVLSYAISLLAAWYVTGRPNNTEHRLTMLLVRKIRESSQRSARD